MSDQEEEDVSEQEEEEEDEEGDEEEGEDEEEEEEEDEEGEDEDEDEDSNEESGDEDEQEGSGEEEKQQEDAESKPLPKFRSIEPEQLKFSNILSELSSLSLNVDHFIGSLPSQGGCSYRKYLPVAEKQQIPMRIPLAVPEESRVVIMKDEDIQVSMQPQIVIQPSKVEKPVAEPSFKISSESNKFLAQLYEENKRLKRWSNTSHSMNSHKETSMVSGGFYGSREKFERKDYEKGLFDVEERNKEIDDAIDLLKRNEE